ncbi:MAG: class I SAM-dependent methyltransferase [Cyclobacteriaceae bacterium]
MKDTHQPLVSCIMPTNNRRKFIPFALRYFLRQNYSNKELIIVDDGTDAIGDLIPEEPSIRYYRLDKKITLGEKLNLACGYTKGEIIAHWDDDDWYVPYRLSYQINALQNGQVDVCGINQLLYFNLSTKHAYQYRYPSNQRAWLLGSSLCYTKAIWTTNPFAPINVGMDALFVWSISPGRVKPLKDSRISVHMIHEDNASLKKSNGSWWYDYPVTEIQQLMKSDWNTYSNGAFSTAKVMVKSPEVIKSNFIETKKPLKNTYACLVHENEDCIIDLVRNLHYYDPSSSILLYNGGENTALFSENFPYESFGARIHPDPIPVQHGYLHPFALRCMDFALENYSFDTLTIVDSDQLALKPGYSPFIGNYLKDRANIGMLSNKPEQILPNNSKVWPAIQAYKEFDLWKPFLKQFQDGEEKFVHWSFWPSSVFTRDATKDLARLFKENKVLQAIMQKTKIWATEEIVLPTLVKLLGYDITQNPCSHDFVRYRTSYTIKDLTAAQKIPNAYWIHPIERKYDNDLRIFEREKSNHYNSENGVWKTSPSANLLIISTLLSSIKGIEGWLADKEAELLISIMLKACNSLPEPHHIVEIGSFQGKSTVVLGTVAKAYFPEAKVYAIDPHEGMVGASDMGIQHVPPTLEKFKHNIENAGLTEVVVLMKDYSYNIKWENPISFLFIDGLHDYPNVARDFWKFSPFVVPGGYIAFHDYADYYPGVQAFVNEILANGRFLKIHSAESLIVVQKVG